MNSKSNPSRFNCYANAENDEPMFVLLARDKHAPQLVELWAGERASEGEDPAKVEEALKCAKAMRKWRYDRKGAPTCEHCVGGDERCLGSSSRLISCNGFMWEYFCGSSKYESIPDFVVQTIEEYFATDEVSNEYVNDEALRVYYETMPMRARANEAAMGEESEADEPKQPSIEEIVRLIKRDCPFWAPEVRVHNLLPYLQTYGDPLYEALMALSEDERKGCGVDKVVVKRREV